jgi:hypothetical protein
MLLACAVPGFASNRPAPEKKPGSEAKKAEREKGAKLPASEAGEQRAEAGTVQGSPDAAAAKADDPDLDVNKAQPDFALSALPTTLRLPRNRMAFRLTHRFNEPLDEAGLADMFGMDSGALIGFEFRYGLLPGGQVGFYRTSDRTIEFFTQYDVKKQGGGMPVGLAAYASVEGTNNFSDKYSPGLGAVISRELGTRAAIYAEPFWINNTNPDPSEIVDHNSTAIVGLGLRVRVLESLYLVAEVAPRIAGYEPGTTHAAFGVERRAGGHLFQLTFANNQGTTLANMARGGPSGNNWYLGFNLSRKFY